MSKSVPIVNYLNIDGDPHLVATVCRSCKAEYLGTRMACSRCGHREFDERRLASDGTIGSFTVIHRGPPGVQTPYVSAIVDLTCGAHVKANIVDCEATGDDVRLGMPVQLVTYPAGVDDNGTEAVAFGFRLQEARA